MDLCLRVVPATRTLQIICRCFLVIFPHDIMFVYLGIAAPTGIVTGNAAWELDNRLENAADRKQQQHIVSLFCVMLFLNVPFFSISSPVCHQ